MELIKYSDWQYTCLTDEREWGKERRFCRFISVNVDENKQAV